MGPLIKCEWHMKYKAFLIIIEYCYSILLYFHAKYIVSIFELVDAIPSDLAKLYFILATYMFILPSAMLTFCIFKKAIFEKNYLFITVFFILYKHS